MEEERKLITEITRGFAGMRDQIQARDDKVSLLSDKMIGVEYKVDQLKETLIKMEMEMSKADNERVKIRLDNLEEANKEVKARQVENGKWIKGLVASVIILLVGFLLNFIRIGLK